MISYGKQSINKDDVKEVSKALRKNLITQGNTVEKFEIHLSKKLKAKFCTVVSNGSSALNIVAKTLEWSKNDFVLTTPISFIATSNCILNQGATPFFVDIDKDTYTLDPYKVESILKRNSFLRKRVKALISVDYAGHPSDWQFLKYLSNKYKFTLINDNCHALGSKYNDDTGYAVKYADIITLSFHPVKQITTGEGGAILTNSKMFDRRFKSLRSHGVFKNQDLIKKKGIWYQEFKELSSNFRMNDFQAALGISQLKRLNKFIKKRKKIAQIYDLEFKKDHRFIIPSTKKNNSHSYHLYPLLINFEKIKTSKKDFFKKLLKKNIKLQVHYVPIVFQPIYRTKLKNFKFDLKNSFSFYKKEVSLPIFYDLKYTQAKKIAKTIKKLAK
mgnify:CR=1 FL=1